MKLGDYLSRIEYEGPVAPDLACLTAIHRQHLLTIPYEDLDVQLRRPLDLDIHSTFEKIVYRRRGGWCYEMNGLLCWVLREIGFEVTRIVGGMSRSSEGDEMMGNHLVLRVGLDAPMLADTGIGDGILDPIRFEIGRSAQGDRQFRIEELQDGHWRFQNHEGLSPDSFDFLPESPADEDRLARTCRNLQDNENSIFRQNLICMQPDGKSGTKMLIGRVLALPGEEKRLLESANELCGVLEDVFGLRDPDFLGLWPQVVARHEVVFGDGMPDELSFDAVV
jgi:N-hydroxyarylamine O-acetyltransferase